MIEGFEVETKPLVQHELDVLPLLLDILKECNGKDNAITSHEICEKLRRFGYRWEGSRIRKMINHIRMHNLIPCLVSASVGYWVETDAEEIKRCIRSERQRASAIMAVANALENQLNLIIYEQQHSVLED